ATPLERHAESVRDDLRDRRRVALALRRKARRAPHAAVRLDAHAGRLDTGHIVHAAPAEHVGAHAGVLRVAREPDADDFSAPAVLTLRLTKTVVLDGGQRLLERLREIAAVVAHAAPRNMPLRLARNQGGPAHFGGGPPGPPRPRVSTGRP